jgi:hypothetical protein
MGRKEQYLNHPRRNNEGLAVDLVKQKEGNMIGKYLEAFMTSLQAFL